MNLFFLFIGAILYARRSDKYSELNERLERKTFRRVVGLTAVGVLELMVGAAIAGYLI